MKIRIVAVLISTLIGLALTQSTFTLKSPDIAAGSTIGADYTFNAFGCSGKNISPALEWSGMPAGTKSLALIVHDPDAPTGVGGFTHWIVYNIPATANGLARGAGATDGRGLPAGTVQATTSFGTPGYGGPCPPQGRTHRYEFTLYALGVEKLELPAGAPQAIAGFNIVGNSIGKASFTATYGR